MTEQRLFLHNSKTQHGRFEMVKRVLWVVQREAIAPSIT